MPCFHNKWNAIIIQNLTEHLKHLYSMSVIKITCGFWNINAKKNCSQWKKLLHLKTYWHLANDNILMLCLLRLKKSFTQGGNRSQVHYHQCCHWFELYWFNDTHFNISIYRHEKCSRKKFLFFIKNHCFLDRGNSEEKKCC